MTASPYASDAKITEAVAAIEADYVGTREQTLLEQIFVACAMRRVIEFYYLRPDGTSYFLRPDGFSLFVRP